MNTITIHATGENGTTAGVFEYPLTEYRLARKNGVVTLQRAWVQECGSEKTMVWRDVETVETE